MVASSADPSEVREPARLDESQVAAYLARIGCTGSREPTFETLRALHLAHLAAVPFENLDIHAGRPIRLDGAAFFRKIVGERRGGFCYELNGLFASLLAALGFEVALLSARVSRSEGGFGAEHDHLALLVTVGGRWLADVGFGRSFHEPLSLDAPVERESEGRLYRAVVDAEGWRVESRRADEAPDAEYAFTLTPQPLAAFAGMCEHHQTSPESSFTRRVVCSLPTARGRVTLSGRTLTVAEGEERRETLLEDAGAQGAALLAHFGIVRPPHLQW